MWLISDSYLLFIHGGEWISPRRDFQTVSEFSFTVEREKKRKRRRERKGESKKRERERMFLK